MLFQELLTYNNKIHSLLKVLSATLLFTFEDRRGNKLSQPRLTNIIILFGSLHQTNMYPPSTGTSFILYTVMLFLDKMFCPQRIHMHVTIQSTSGIF